MKMSTALSFSFSQRFTGAFVQRSVTPFLIITMAKTCFRWLLNEITVNAQ